MTVFEYGDDMVVVDAGIMFPDDDHPGVDLILPDYCYIVKRKDKLRGIVITHGHEDHTGALPYLLKELGPPVPVLGTKLTLGLIQGKLEEHKLKKVKLREIKAGSHVSLGPFGFDFFAVNHSIPDAVGIFIRTPAAQRRPYGRLQARPDPDRRPPDRLRSPRPSSARSASTCS